MNRPPDRPAVPVPRPSEVCRQLLHALEASEGRRRQRKRDTTPDAIGLALRRRLLEAAVRADPDPAEFEAWLLRAAERETHPNTGAALAMARAILEDWQLACVSPGVQEWLRAGSPSADR